VARLKKPYDLTGFRAHMQSGAITQIVDALVGTNTKPLVVYQGAVRERVAAEGRPFCWWVASCVVSLQAKRLSSY